MADVATAAVRLVSERARANGLTLDVDLSEVTGVRLVADTTKLMQILINLLSNSAKLTPSGGSVRLTARLTADGGTEFEVADTGIGMTAGELERVTQPYVQCDSIYHKRFAGAGLGLSISKALAEKHDAVLHIISMPENGTTVRVRFPAKRVQHTAIGDQPAEPLIARTAT